MPSKLHNKSKQIYEKLLKTIHGRINKNDICNDKKQSCWLKVFFFVFNWLIDKCMHCTLANETISYYDNLRIRISCIFACEHNSKYFIWWVGEW